MRTRLPTAIAIALSLSLVACLDRTPAPLDPCTRSGVVERFRMTRVENVDLLFMIDNSGSMSQEQASLVAQIPRLIQVLASGDESPDDGIEIGVDFPPVTSLHVGVISSDMGTGGFRVPTCNEPNFGDDGILLQQGDTASGCMASYPTSFLTYQSGAAGADPLAFARDVSCISVLGTGGCGFEQQLEAMLKAVTPSTQEPVGAFDGVFTMGQPGHGDNTNTGFVREDSLLAIIAVTDEEDCSAADLDLFNGASAVYTGDPNLRCFQYANHPNQPVHPVQRYVDGLLARRPDPNLFIFAGIVGVPTDLVHPTTDYDAILADPRMQEMVDPDMPTRLRPSCEIPGRGEAYPPRRFVELARDLDARGAGGIIQSICQADFTPAIDAIIEKLVDVLRGTCLPRQLNPDEMGRVECDVVEVLPTTGDVTTCAAIPGRESIGVDPDTGGEVCRVAQVAAGRDVTPVAPGWYYDDFSSDVRTQCATIPTGAQRIAFTTGNEPRSGVLLRLECLQPVQGGGGPTVLDVYSACQPEVVGADVCMANGPPPGDPTSGARCARNLVCDPIAREWQAPCSSDADCSTAGLGAFRCDTGRAAGPAICVNPTCS
jgi:hypothetical protein